MQVVLAYRNADKLVWWNGMDHHCGSSPAFLTDCKLLEFSLESVFHLFLSHDFPYLKMMILGLPWRSSG